MKKTRIRIFSLPMALLLPLGLIIAACSGDSSQVREVERDEYNTGSRREQLLRSTSAAGTSGGITLFGGGTEKGQESGGAGGGGLGVNAFLWRATLDTLSFMPLASADPFGGVIITDWHAPGGVSSERFKATAYVLGRQLRSDGVRISLFRQVRGPGGWVDAPVSAATAAELEDKVLARARELRSQSAGR
ncbi:MAG: DUF3576 domain-containing protein [Roseomonas sp.]|nr:DUF3576 domain-containing protein [Roseomonas sp.]MCA3367447.1 DUF3576 domain-containing protein [Roseomonas sp.]MCA3379443.1 DUF3576 domain-containing protein [Roseomonas sp.]